MDDSNILYYIVLGVIFLVSRLLKKKKPQPSPSEENASDEPVPERKSRTQTTFEDLFKEITGEDYGSKKQESVLEAEEYDESTKRFESLEELSDPEPVKVEEKKPVTHQFKMPEEKNEFGRSEKYRIKEEVSPHQDILDMLADQNGARKAIILKEIFDRKY